MLVISDKFFIINIYNLLHPVNAFIPTYVTSFIVIFYKLEHLLKALSYIIPTIGLFIFMRFVQL